MKPKKQSTKRNLHFAGLVYLFTIILAFYLLYISRVDEVYTIWQMVSPLFIVVFFAATFLLILICLSFEKTEFKLLFSIVHSILSLSFYAIVFPFGRVGVPQMVLGEIRLVFDNITPLGLPAWSRQPAENIVLQVYRWGRVYNLETLLTVVFARMFSVDVYWINLLLIPLLWGIFVPVTAFAVAKELSGSKRVSVLAGLMSLLFPTLIFYGTFSNRNSLGFIFFFGSLYFFLKYLSSDEYKWPVLMLLFSSASFLSHFLTGIMSLSLLLLAFAFKPYMKMREESPKETKINLLLATVISTVLLPMSLLLHSFLYHLTTSFSLDKLSEHSVTEVLSLFAIGELVNFGFTSALVFGIGPLLGFIGMMYHLRSFRYVSNKNSRKLTIFLLAAFLIMLVDYRVIRLFMVNVPFEEERIWAFSDLIAVPFVALLIGSFVPFIREKASNASNKIDSRIAANVKSVVLYVVIVLLLSGWITASIYYAYPSYGSLQTTTYEVEAVKYIDETTKERYIVVADPWIIFAGQMFVGIHNPRAFYFFYQDPKGVALFIKMKNNPSNDTLLEAMKYNNATTAYFTIEQPRLGTQEFSRIIQQAEQNKVRVYKTFGNGKLYIFYYKND